MFTRLKKSLAAKDQGFTLIELLVVVVIIGILAAVAIPTFLGQKDKATESGVKSDLKNASAYVETYAVDNGTYTGATEALLESTYSYKPTVGDTVTLKVPTDGKSYCIGGQSSKGGGAFHLSSVDGAVVTGACP